jgi:hypothetical protein
LLQPSRFGTNTKKSPTPRLRVGQGNTNLTFPTTREGRRRGEVVLSD